MPHLSFFILNTMTNKLLVILLLVFLCVSCSITNKEINHDNKTLELAIGSLIKYDIDSKISLNYATSLKLTKVYQTYYSKVITLPKKERAQFFFIVDNHINVTGGSNLFDYYDLVYSCCEEEYINLIKQNIDNPYFDSEVLKNKLGVIETTGDRIKEVTAPYEKSENDHLKELKDLYLSQD